MAKSMLTLGIILFAVLTLFSGGCAQNSTPTTTPPVTYSTSELKYILIANFEQIFYVDPDIYPIAKEGQEEKNALEQFTIISANTEEFSAILKHLGLPTKADYTNEEKLSIYREHKKLTLAVELIVSRDTNNFILRVREGQGERIEGTITNSGEIKIRKKEPSFNTYPICLAKGTLIDTPSGPLPVDQLHKGMPVWTVDRTGIRSPAIVLKTTRNSVPASFQITRITLSDGHTVTASPGHPTAEGRVLGDYHVDDTLDGALVVAVEHVSYDGYTYDILTSGTTGLYWANGILLQSTLATY
jgi:hypothetical protein